MLYTAVRDNIPLNIIQNVDTTFYNNNFSTAVGYVSTKMGREHIRDAKKPYATTNIYNPGAHLSVVPLYTNPLQIGKLLQLQQWPNCPRVGGACHQPHILCKPDMAIVLEEIQFHPPAQAQVAGQAPPSGPGGPAQAPAGPPGGGGPPAGGPSTSGQGAAQQGNDDDDDEEPEEDDDPCTPDDEYPEEDDNDNGNYECDEEEEEESTDDSQDDSDEYDDIYDDDNDHNDDVCAPGEYHDDNDDPNDETNPCQKRKCESPLKEAKKHKTSESSMPLREHKERVETIVDVPREHEMEQIPQEESLLSPELTTPHQSRVQDTPPRRHSPRIKNQTVTGPIPATPLEFVHPGIENTAVRIETPQNPSSERNQRISRKLVLGTPLGANPQQSTSMGGENVKTIPGKGAPKTGWRGRGCGHGVPSGRGAPSGRGPGLAPTGAHAPVPGVVTRAAAAAVAGGGGGGGGAGVPVVPVPNAQYIYRSPLVIIEIEGKKVSWDHNKYASKAFCAMACGLAFAPQGYIVHVFPDKVDVISTFRDVNDMTIKCEAERINMQRDDQNLATQFDTLTDRSVEILVKQLMTTATTANLSFAQKQILGLKYHSDASMRHGPACLNCFRCPTLNSVRATNQDAAVLATPYKTF